MRPRLSLRLATIIVPAVMILVASVQFTLVRAHGLTAWKGGGFGMFSTFDSPRARTLRIVLETPTGDALVVNPSLDVVGSRVLNFPTDATLEGIAAEVMRQPWRLYDAETVVAMRAHLPPSFTRQIDQALANQQARAGDSLAAAPLDIGTLAFDEKLRPEQYASRPAEVRAVRAEVWRFTYDRDNRQMAAEIVNAARTSRH